MFDWFSANSNDAVSMLKRDHDAVKDLFDRFESAEQAAEKRKIARRAIEELRVHAAIEEEIFYPAVREHLAKNDPKLNVMNEADEEHHVAKVLIAELDRMQESGDHWEAKFKVLAENVRHHIKEEENQMLPKATDLQIDFEELGRRMEARKQELKAHALPPTSEDRMVGSAGNGHAPAPRKKAAARKPAAHRTTARHTAK